MSKRIVIQQIYPFWFHACSDLVISFSKWFLNYDVIKCTFPYLINLISYWAFFAVRDPTVPTGPNLTPKRTPKADPRFALGPLRVRFSKMCVRFGSARSPLWVRSGSALSPLGVRSASALGEGSALRTHAWSGPRSVVTAYKPRPLYIPNTLSSQFIMK